MKKNVIQRKYFRKYLESKGVLEEFIEAVIREQGEEKAALTLANPDATIDNCLYWIDSEQGHNYWSDLNDGWLGSKFFEKEQSKMIYVSSYRLKKRTKGFSLGCQNFKFSDIVLIAKTWRSTCGCCSKTITLSNGFEVKVRRSGLTILNYGERLVTVEEVNHVLRMYKLKLLEV